MDGAVRDRESKVLRMEGATWTKKIRRGRRETASMQVEGDVLESEMLLVSLDGAVRDRERRHSYSALSIGIAKEYKPAALTDSHHPLLPTI